MARLLGAKCKYCLREGDKLFLKGYRCDTVKCAIERKSQESHKGGRTKRIRLTDYGKHLRETQKLKRLYGISQRQLKGYFAEASRLIGNTGENLLRLLESRLDNVISEGGFAPSRITARQLIVHSHVILNGRRASIPSIKVKPGDTIKPAGNETSTNMVKKYLESARKEQVPSWLRLSTEPAQLEVIQLPKRTDITTQINEQMVVEFCSR